MKPILILDNVSAAYGNHTVLSQISLEVKHGETLLITGPNGSGKSTLLKIISGNMEPKLGSVEVLGIPLDSRSNQQKIRQQIGFLTQIQFDPKIAVSVRESVLLGLWGTSFSWLKRPRKEDRLKAMDRLAVVGMADLAHRDMRSLSGGQRQRVACARALIRDPALILMDEPTTYLDVEAKEELIILLNNLQDRLNFTAIMVSHEPPTSFVSNRTLHLKNGRIVPKTEVPA
ncbi:MAG: ATP-binding cassette domain-containing protein [Sphaerochaetaceae bacterium]|nr:ATP-binding cassette domain-containing protein [Sphaerochaetaceae bacterium]MDD3366886.1 ATP-binding cassette domain-containing protein [Sphaerochaetaceae bacterium]